MANHEFWRNAAALDKACARGAISLYEYRVGLRDLGLSLVPDEDMFPDLAPLPIADEVEALGFTNDEGDDVDE